MSAAAIPDDLRLAAPDFGRRLGLILAALAALIARAFLRNPARVALIVPLWTYLNRTARRFERLMGRIAAGRLPRKHRPGRSGPRATALPTAHAWLVRDLRHEAAAYGCQLEALLAEPTLAGLLAASPSAARLLRPVCRMLGLKPAVLAPPPAPPSPGARTAQPEPPEPRPAAPPPPRRATGLPDPPCPRVRRPWFPGPAEKPR